eukprot:351328-Chlamydomonas_euryale.AAC.14
MHVKPHACAPASRQASRHTLDTDLDPTRHKGLDDFLHRAATAGASLAAVGHHMRGWHHQLQRALLHDDTRQMALELNCRIQHVKPPLPLQRRAR